jgi:hypothetical protein
MARREGVVVVETQDEDGTVTENDVDVAGGAAAAGLSNNPRKLSPKAKASRGVAEDQITTWVPVDNDQATNEKLRKVAKARGVKVADVLVGLLREALEDEDVQALLDEDAAKAPEAKVRTPKVEEALPEDPAEAEKVLRAQAEKAQAKLAKVERAMENARKAIDAAKAKAQERGLNIEAPAQADAPAA